MRNFIVSILCLILLLGIWTIFDSYSNQKIHNYQYQLEENILSSVENREWDQALSDFQALSRDWHQYKKKAAFFLDTSAINDADYSIARAKYYIKEKDASNASGELACLKEQLTFLHYNETIAPGNIL